MNITKNGRKKMRLIDLDKAVSICDEDNNTVIFANIENAEVKAIPIEWIKKKSLEFLMNRNFRWATDFQEVIDMWKVENNIPLFDDEYKPMPNRRKKMKDYVSLYKSVMISYINEIIEGAVFHGGDSGGPYFSNMDDLLSKMRDFRTWAGLDEYKICVVGDIPKFVKLADGE